MAQRIKPRTQWFFDGIDTASGDPLIERKAFELVEAGLRRLKARHRPDDDALCARLRQALTTPEVAP